MLLLFSLVSVTVLNPLPLSSTTISKIKSSGYIEGIFNVIWLVSVAFMSISFMVLD